MSFRLFPACTRGFGFFSNCDTFVVLDLEGYSISDIPRPCAIRERIESVVANDGHSGQVDFQVYAAEDGLWNRVLDCFMEARMPITLEVPGGGKVMKLNRRLVDVLHWALTLHRCNEPSNVLILSKNTENIKQDPNFFKFRATLEKNDFHVALEQLETLLDLNPCVDGGNPIIES